MKKIWNIFLSLLLVSALFLVGCDNGGGAGGKTPLQDGGSTGTTKLILGESQIELEIGKSYTLPYIVKNSQQAVVFTSVDSAIATVNAQGEIVAVGVGSTTIIVSVENEVQNCIVTVRPAPTYAVWLNEQSVLLAEGSMTYQITARLQKGYETINGAIFTYFTENAEVATVSESGEITSVSAGSTHIVVSSTVEEKTYFKRLPVLVNERAYLDIETSASYNLLLETVEPAFVVRDFEHNEIIGAQVSIVSADENIVKPTTDGRLQLKKKGDTTITLIYGTISATIAVKVWAPPQLLEITGENGKILYGENSYFSGDILYARIPNGEKLVLNQKLDISSLTAMDTLIELGFAPIEAGKADVKRLTICLTDAYDENNKVYITFMDNGGNDAASAVASFTGSKVEIGFEAIKDSGAYKDKQLGFASNGTFGTYTPMFFKGNGDRNHMDYNGGMSKIAYDFANKQVHALTKIWSGMQADGSIYKTIIADLAQTDYTNCALLDANYQPCAGFAKIFEGFTTGEVYLSIYGEGYTGTNCGVAIRSIFGINLSQYASYLN